MSVNERLWDALSKCLVVPAAEFAYTKQKAHKPLRQQVNDWTYAEKAFARLMEAEPRLARISTYCRDEILLRALCAEFSCANLQNRERNTLYYPTFTDVLTGVNYFARILKFAPTSPNDLWLFDEIEAYKKLHGEERALFACLGIVAAWLRRIERRALANPVAAFGEEKLEPGSMPWAMLCCSRYGPLAIQHLATAPHAIAVRVIRNLVRLDLYSDPPHGFGVEFSEAMERACDLLVARGEASARELIVELETGDPLLGPILELRLRGREAS